MSNQFTAMMRRHFSFVLIAGSIVAPIAGVAANQLLFPGPDCLTEQPPKHVVPFWRQQQEFPDFSDVVDRLCPSMAKLPASDVEASSGISDAPAAVPAFVVSAEGWLLVSILPTARAPHMAVFGDGRTAKFSDMRTDPVSGLTIIKTEPGTAPPLLLDEQFPRVGRFGLAMETWGGRGCSAIPAMIVSDFHTDGDAAIAYARFDVRGSPWKGGLPLLGPEGRIVGISIDHPAGGVIPATVLAVIIDELMRNSLSPSTSFGFRAIDHVPTLATRLGMSRSGTGVAIVQAGSQAERAGLRADDVIWAVNGVPVSSASALNRLLDAPRNQVALTLQRESEQLSISIARASPR